VNRRAQQLNAGAIVVCEVHVSISIERQVSHDASLNIHSRSGSISASALPRSVAVRVLILRGLMPAHVVPDLAEAAE
jgi:hypothetical protein